MKILYHSNCNDGMGAALAVWMLYGDEGNDYIPVQYGENLPFGLVDEKVILVDFSYKRKMLIDLSCIAQSITIIDHHKSAEKELTGVAEECFCPVTLYFDMEKSGAVLAWEVFHPGTPVPELLGYVQDYDLWRHRLAGSRDVHAALQVDEDFREWLTYIEEPKDITRLAEEGESINAWLDMQARKIIKTPPSQWLFDGQKVPVYNLPGFMISRTLELALAKYQESPYAVSFFVLPNKNTRVYSLRSRKGSDVDVSLIAERNGGGGHKHSASFYVDENKT